MKKLNLLVRMDKNKFAEEMYSEDGLSQEILNFLEDVKKEVEVDYGGRFKYFELTEEEFKELGISKWEDNKYMLPILLYPLMDKNTLFTSIMDNEVLVKDMNLDIRGGYLAYFKEAVVLK